MRTLTSTAKKTRFAGATAADQTGLLTLFSLTNPRSTSTHHCQVDLC